MLTHELVHLEHELHGCQPPTVERMVRDETVRLLIELDDLVPAERWPLSLGELADELGVTPMVLPDRFEGLAEGERQTVEEGLGAVPNGNVFPSFDPFSAP